MKEHIVGIYKITSPNNRIYVGQSRNIFKRWKSYSNLKINKHPRLHNSFIKYGVENHIFEVIEECLFEELNIRERYWQDFYDVTGEKGLNCTLIETNTLPRVISNETRKKLREGKLGINNPMFGKFGELNPMFGKVVSEEGRKIQSQKLKKKLTGEYGSKGSKKVIDTSTSIIYPSATQVSKIFNIELATLSSYLVGKRNNKTPFLYLWEVEKLLTVLNNGEQK